MEKAISAMNGGDGFGSLLVLVAAVWLWCLKIGE